MGFRLHSFRHPLTWCACAALAGCAGGRMTRTGEAVADLQPTRGSFVTGTITFKQAGDRVVVTADVRGLSANGEAGFHVHEHGDCSAIDGSSAGPHFNPFNKPHGHEGSARHAGDMPNLKADATGRALYRVELDVMTLDEGPAGIVGRSVIVHRDPDDYMTQPAGNSGPRVACGIIRRAER
jgi:Cu-Zn family superoxide dismutase